MDSLNQSDTANYNSQEVQTQLTTSPVPDLGIFFVIKGFKSGFEVDLVALGEFVHFDLGLGLVFFGPKLLSQFDKSGGIDGLIQDKISQFAEFPAGYTHIRAQQYNAHRSVQGHFAHLAKYRGAVDFGHHEVEDHQVKGLPIQKFQPFTAILKCRDLISDGLKRHF
jgi:hypothetical protein